MANYVTFEMWRTDSVERGAKCKKVTVSNFNTYWQAIREGRVIGFFNTCEGKKGRRPTDGPAGKLFSEEEIRPMPKEHH